MKLENMKLPPEPKGLDEYIRRCAAETYFIYDKRQHIATCTRCGHVFDPDNLKHNKPAKCPACNMPGTAKAYGRGRENIEEKFRVISVQTRAQKLYINSYVCHLKFTDFGKPKVRKYIDEIFTFKEIAEKWRYDIWTREYFNSGRIKLSNSPSIYGYHNPLNTVYIYGDLKKAFQNTKLKYVYSESFIKQLTAHELIKYIDEAWRYQSIEILLKEGFAKLVIEKIGSAATYSAVNWRGKRLQSILRLNMAEIRKVREWNIVCCQLKAFQGLTQGQRAKITYEELYALSRLSDYTKGELKEVPILKYIKYKLKQDVNEHDYIDYIRAIKELRLDITKKSVIFPKDFKRAHDQALAEKKVIENEEKNKAIAAATFDINIERNGLIASMARSQTELTDESSKLNHCVRTYGDRVAQGKTWILFIRKSENPNVPYYTLEVSPEGEFRQCRGAHNCSMTVEVEAFKDYVVQEFKKILKERKKAA